ncbi:MAG TPA: hypothetical protein VFO18_15415 [Methylomirabilota bacterium]|nr:hypothetical protein [Methylomirabilota bacterium]
MMRGVGRLGWVSAVALLAAGCLSTEIVERTTRGPQAQEFLIARSYEINGRGPNFEEKGYWEAQIDDRIAKYLREHPELQQTTRFSDFRFWKQVTPGSTPAEVRVLLEDPTEQTIDPALMAVLAKRHWPEIRSKVKEAWVYPLGWVLYFDDKGVVEMIRRVSPVSADD